ncbi:hypothetical protein WJX72_011462 [[Myrmecia] bisecta]|uniref:Tubulin-specific chaperone A n=1 Tax=[Myrmecia] bisecta TaxID=41462 RepID=A0AAW1P7D6_9CHLO
MADQEIRQVKIKTGSVRRLAKELALYEKEREAEQAKVDRLKADGAEIHDLKHAENVLAEASMMIPDTRQRLQAALGDLKYLVAEVEDNPDVIASEEFAAAKAIIAEMEPLFQ